MVGKIAVEVIICILTLELLQARVEIGKNYVKVIMEGADVQLGFLYKHIGEWFASPGVTEREYFSSDVSDEATSTDKEYGMHIIILGKECMRRRERKPYKTPLAERFKTKRRIYFENISTRSRNN